MIRLGFAGLTAVLLASAGPAVAASGDDTPAEVMRDCGGDSLPRDEVSSCLERARVLDQSNPSPQLQSLEARLEQRVKASPEDADTPPPPARYDQMGADDDRPPPPDEDSGNGSPDDEMGPNDQPPPDEDTGPDDQGPPDENSGPDNQPPDAGSWDDDEPPIDDSEDGYDNSQPDPGYDAPDAPDDDQGPPPDDDDDTYEGGQG
jgi:hypothetical protein